MPRNVELTYNCKEGRRSFTYHKGEEHCHVCSTTIIDFTDKTSEEIIQILSQQTGSVCGKVFDDQLSNPVPETSRFSPKLMLAGLATATGLIAVSPEVKATQTVRVEQTDKLREDLITSSSTNLPVALATSNPVIDEEPKNERSKLRKPFMRIGRRYFFTSSSFPFIESRVIRRGKIASKNTRFR